MEELQFVPSQQVWQNVEKELPKERKRRRWLILPLLVLGMLAGAYFIFNEKNVAESAITKNTPVARAQDNALSEPSTNNQPKASNPTPHRATINQSEKNKNSATVSQPKNGDPLAAGGLVKEPLNNGSLAGQNTIEFKGADDRTAVFHRQDEKRLNQRKLKDKKMVITGSSYSEEKNKDGKEQVSSFQSLITKADADKKNIINTDPIISVEDKAGQAELDATIQPESLAANEMLPGKDSIGERPAAMQTRDSISKTAIAVKSAGKKNKWKWLGNIEAGFANLNNSFAPLGALGISGVSEAAKSATTSIPMSLQTNTSPFQLSSPPPANPRPGFSYKIGVVAEKAVSRRSNFTIGISYAFLSTRGSSGAVANGNNSGANFSGVQNDLLSSRQYYLNTSNKEFGNEYHFLQLPVSFSTLLGRGKRLPFYWNTGVSVNYLLTSNALVYDNISRAYYKDKGIFRPLQLGWHTGIEAEFFFRKSRPLRLGPQFNFNFSQLLKTPSGDKQRFAYAGIRAGLQLNKK